MANVTNIPAPRVPFLDARSGLMSREWYQFFLSLFNLTGGGTNPISLDDVQVAPIYDVSNNQTIEFLGTAQDSYQILKSIDDLSIDVSSAEQKAIEALSSKANIYDAVFRGGMDIILDADDNIFVDGRTNPRTITLGVFRIEHTPDLTGTRPINLDINANGFSDTKAINIDFIATAVSEGDNHALSLNVDTANSSGGDSAGLSVSKTGSGAINVVCIEAYAGVGIADQRVGVLTVIEQAFTYSGAAYTDVTANFSNSASNVQLFVNDGDYVYIGQAVQFDDIDVVLSIPASGAGVKPIFEYSQGAGVWQAFTATDNTNGFRGNGNIILPITDITALWATDTVNGVAGKYWIRIQRNSNNLSTPPTESLIKVITSVMYGWDSDAQVNVRDLVLTKDSGYGIKVDNVSPTFGWRDLLGEPHIHSAGANDPTWQVYRGSINQFQYSNVIMNETWYEYHIPHDYVPGTDVYAHVDWSQIVVDTGGPAGVPGTVKWYFDITYAKGHGTAGGASDAFTAPITTSVTQQGSTTQYGHLMAETVITDDGTALIDRSRLEPDGIIILRMYRDPADAADTLDQEPFVHSVDIHYQSTNMATKQKSPNFYV